MTSARYSQVTDELLSAYLDDAVTLEERRWVEAAIADDPGIAWRLESLRITVQLLHELPALALPRSFALTPEQIQGSQLAPAVAIVPAPSLPATTQPVRTPENDVGFWSRLAESWQRFWTPGNPVFRNAMAASFAALLVLMVVPGMLAPALQPAPVTGTTANVADAEGAAMVAAVAPAEQAQTQTDAGAKLRREAPQPTAVPAVETLEAAMPMPTNVPDAPDAPAVAMVASGSSAREVAGGGAATGATTASSLAQAAPPGPRNDVLAEAAAQAPAVEAPLSDSAVSAMTMDANVVSAAPGAQAEGATLYAPEVAAAAAPSAPAAAAKLAAVTEPASEVETFSALEPAALTSAATAATAANIADQVVAGDAAPVAAQGEAPALEAVEAPVQPLATATMVVFDESTTMVTAPEPPQRATSSSIWWWLQTAAALGVLGFGILWWRTRPS